MIYYYEHKGKLSTDVHGDKWEPPVAERRAPHVCFHGFMPEKCLAPVCENYFGGKRGERR